MNSKRINEISDAFDDWDGESLTQMKEQLGSKFSWEELKLYRASLII